MYKPTRKRAKTSRILFHHEFTMSVSRGWSYKSKTRLFRCFLFKFGAQKTVALIWVSTISCLAWSIWNLWKWVWSLQFLLKNAAFSPCTGKDMNAQFTRKHKAGSILGALLFHCVKIKWSYALKFWINAIFRSLDDSYFESWIRENCYWCTRRGSSNFDGSVDNSWGEKLFLSLLSNPT